MTDQDPTAGQITISEAARLAKRSRQTIYRAIESGRLSCSISDTGDKLIQVAELERVYGTLAGVPSRGGVSQVVQGVTSELSDLREEVAELREERAALKERVRALEERLRELSEDRDWCRTQIEEATKREQAREERLALPAPSWFERVITAAKGKG